MLMERLMSVSSPNPGVSRSRCRGWVGGWVGGYEERWVDG